MSPDRVRVRDCPENRTRAPIVFSSRNGRRDDRVGPVPTMVDGPRSGTRPRSSAPTGTTSVQYDFTQYVAVQSVSVQYDPAQHDHSRRAAPDRPVQDCPTPVRKVQKRGRPPRCPRCSRAQPQERVARPAPRRPDRLHRAVRLGQVLARLRHDLRRGPAALRRVALGLRPAVPRPDGQAGRRLHRGPVPGRLDRPEVDLAEPALDRRHDHRGLRLPAAAVRPDRPPALPRVRAADRPADRRSRSSTGSWSSPEGTRFQVLAPVVRGPQGRVRRPVRRPADQGLQPGPGSTASIDPADRAAACSRSRRSTPSRWSSTGSR